MRRDLKIIKSIGYAEYTIVWRGQNTSLTHPGPATRTRHLDGAHGDGREPRERGETPGNGMFFENFIGMEGIRWWRP